MHLDDEQVRLAVASRIAWIRKQQAKLHRQARQSQRQIIDGESHYLWGRRYRLKVVELTGKAEVRIRGNSIIVPSVPPTASRERREVVLNEWYRNHLKTAVPELIEKWQPVLGVRLQSWGVRKMKTRWGSCNTTTGKVWLNLELAKKPPQALEYILVHEMSHLLERRHNDRFTALLDSFMPQWRTYRDELNSFPLRHEDWTH